MKMLLLAAFALVMAAVLVTVFLNRESSEVVTAAVPVAFGAASALWLVFAFAQAESITKSFPVTFFIQQSDKLPIVLPDRPFPPETLSLVDRARQANPKVLDEQSGSEMYSAVYHEFLQRAIVDQIASRHFGTWRMEIERFEGGIGQQEQFRPKADSSDYRSLILSTEDVARIFGRNRFAGVYNVFGKLALPPGTTLIVRPPEGDMPKGEIRFRSWFFDIRIESTASMSGVGLGTYAPLVGMPLEQAQKQYWHQDFIVRATATFPRFLMGHPHTAAYREWAQGIIDVIADFDEERIWRRTKDNYMLRQHFPAAARELAPPMGPIRSSPPAKPANEPKQQAGS